VQTCNVIAVFSVSNTYRMTLPNGIPVNMYVPFCAHTATANWYLRSALPEIHIMNTNTSMFFRRMSYIKGCHKRFRQYNIMNCAKRSIATVTEPNPKPLKQKKTDVLLSQSHLPPNLTTCFSILYLCFASQHLLSIMSHQQHPRWFSILPPSDLQP